MEKRNPTKRESTTKRKKLNVTPGRSVAFEDTPEKNIDEYEPRTSKVQSVKRKIVDECVESEESSEEEFRSAEETKYIEFDPTLEDFNNSEVKEGVWVVVEY
ncbi:hypothetical protein NQ314_001749 [Rhamnusium bicolor]|uniref:Chlororespiratory reduction 7 n=1 Tax=Rhamnusium bicolor TaxID=1586634 RepID=A0AAV8ZUL5_9CUCU|nr:hypothetical protein NQ314_001749 [Rhamnusium bicolor]